MNCVEYVKNESGVKECGQTAVILVKYLNTEIRDTPLCEDHRKNA